MKVILVELVILACLRGRTSIQSIMSFWKDSLIPPTLSEVSGFYRYININLDIRNHPSKILLGPSMTFIALLSTASRVFFRRVLPNKIGFEVQEFIVLGSCQSTFIKMNILFTNCYRVWATHLNCGPTFTFSGSKMRSFKGENRGLFLGFQNIQSLRVCTSSSLFWYTVHVDLANIIYIVSLGPIPIHVWVFFGKGPGC